MWGDQFWYMQEEANAFKEIIAKQESIKSTLKSEEITLINKKKKMLKKGKPEELGLDP